ncbi:MAG: hypothetical protein HUU21_16935 [Polyangiaceae bacterium]|nr:hypothetical protein [Polyangiaceae bacterium]
MGQSQESSVLFSLNELMSIEDQRLKEEQAAAQKRADEELAARVEAERIERETEAARLQAEEERRRVEEARRREEAARLEAIRLAEVEKARAMAEQQARLEAMARQQQHEQKLAELAHDKQKKRLQKIVTYGSLSAILVIGGVLGVYFGKIKPEADAENIAAAAQIRAQQEESERLRRDVEEKNARVDKLLADLQAAQSKAEQERLARELAAAQKDRDVASKRWNVGPKGPAKNEPCVCKDPGDPLCGCIK